MEYRYPGSSKLSSSTIIHDVLLEGVEKVSELFLDTSISELKISIKLSIGWVV